MRSLPFVPGTSTRSAASADGSGVIISGSGIGLPTARLVAPPRVASTTQRSGSTASPGRVQSDERKRMSVREFNVPPAGSDSERRSIPSLGGLQPAQHVGGRSGDIFWTISARRQLVDLVVMGPWR